ncbi:MAG: hypothetical protein ABDH91_07805 [Bacteroidia bacterium]
MEGLIWTGLIGQTVVWKVKTHTLIWSKIGKSQRRSRSAQTVGKEMECSGKGLGVTSPNEFQPLELT